VARVYSIVLLALEWFVNQIFWRKSDQHVNKGTRSLYDDDDDDDE
jgi:hypothetical protein